MRFLNYSGVSLLCLFLAFTSCRSKKDLGSSSNSSTTNWRETLGLSKKDVKESKLYRFVDQWYGVPYKYGGCQKNGVDCSCFTANLYADVYGRKLGRTAGEIHKDCEKINTGKLREGDLVFFITNGKSISHVGVYLKENKFVHASTSKGVIISDLNETYYKKYFHSAGRIKKEST